MDLPRVYALRTQGSTCKVWKVQCSCLLAYHGFLPRLTTPYSAIAMPLIAISKCHRHKAIGDSSTIAKKTRQGCDSAVLRSSTVDCCTQPSCHSIRQGYTTIYRFLRKIQYSTAVPQITPWHLPTLLRTEVCCRASPGQYSTVHCMYPPLHALYQMKPFDFNS